MRRGQLGSFALLLLTAACAPRGRMAELYPDVVEHGGAEIKGVEFVGAEPFGIDTLQAMIETKPTHCTLLGFPICLPLGNFGREKHTVDPNAVIRDAGRLTV